MRDCGLIRSIFAGLVGWLALCLPTHAQVYSGNIVGYYNSIYAPGNYLIANQLASGGNTLNEIISNTVPEGTTFTGWNPTTDQYLPISTFDTTTGWSINYMLTYGQGGLLTTPVLFTNVYVGEVWPGLGVNSFTPPLVSGTGTFLLSSYVPFADTTFYDVVGRDPLNGDSVQILNPTTQSWSTDLFQNGSWNNGAPDLGVGQSAFFNLQTPATPTPVPEPSAIALAGLGFGLLARLKRRL